MGCRMAEPTPEALAAAIEVPWGKICGHLVVDDKELCRRIAAALRDYAAAEVAKEREAAAKEVERLAAIVAGRFTERHDAAWVALTRAAAAIRQRGERAETVGGAGDD